MGGEKILSPRGFNIAGTSAPRHPRHSDAFVRLSVALIIQWLKIFPNKLWSLDYTNSQFYFYLFADNSVLVGFLFQDIGDC